MQLIDRFLRYVKMDTQSDDATNLVPSTPSQMEFAKKLAEELRQIGLQEVSLDKNAYVMATLPANTDKVRPVIGFIAHMDTSPDMPGRKVQPQIVRKYNGQDIVLNAKENIVLSPQQFPELLHYIGQDLILH